MDLDTLKAAYARIDQLDSVDFAARFTDQGRLTFGNNPPAIGRDAIKAALDSFFTLLTAMHHQFLATWHDDASWSLEAEVTYSLKNGARVPVSGVTVLRTDGDHLRDVRVYYDMAPVLAAAKQPAARPAAPVIEHRQDESGGEFVVEQHGRRVAEMTYTRAGENLIVSHTWVSDSLRGQGIARRLLDELVGFVRTSKLRVIPICPYARAVFAKDPSIRDVLPA